MPELLVQLPLNPSLSLEKFHNIAVNEKYKDAVITAIKLFTHYTKPGYATLYVTGVDKDTCRFTKQVEMTYRTELIDINTGVAKMTFEKKKTETWYKLDRTLAELMLK